jgi:hypothetical protein
MRRCCALLGLVFCVSSFALDHPLVLVGNSINQVEFPKGADRFWLGDSKSNVISTITADGEKFLVTIPNFNGLMAARHRVDGKWSSIYPVRCFWGPPKLDTQIRDLPKGSLLKSRIAISEIDSKGSVDIPFLVEAKLDYRIETFANSAGSQLDPVLRILDPTGKEIADNDDSLMTGRDSEVTFKAKSKGAYTITVRDVANGSGPNYYFAVRWSFANLSSEERFVEPFSSYPEDWKTYEKAPETSAYNPASLKVGHKYRNFFSNGGEEYRFSLKENQKIIITATTRQFGSPCDAGLALFDENGKLLGESVGSQAMGAALTNSLNKGCCYKLKIREISKLTGVLLPYWLTIQESTPGIVLNSETERVAFSNAGDAQIKINCERSDYTGAVSLKIDALPEGVSIIASTIPEKKNEGELKLKANGKVEAFNIRIHGEIEIEDSKEPKRIGVSTMPALRKLFPLQLFPSAAMDGWIAVNPPQ